MLLSHQYSHRPDEPLTHAGKKARWLSIDEPSFSRRITPIMLTNKQDGQFSDPNEPRLSVYILIDGARLYECNYRNCTRGQWEYRGIEVGCEMVN